MFRSAPLTALLFLTTSLCAQHPPAGGSSSEAALAPLLSAQQQSLSTGDPTAVAAATRPLLAQTLVLLAQLDRASGNAVEADSLQQQAASLVASAPASPQHSRPVPAAQRKQQAAHLKAILASAWSDLGTAEARQGEFAAALLDFQHAEHFASPPPPALFRSIGTAAFRLGDWQEATRALRAYLASQPTADADSPSRLMLSMALFSSGDFPAAAQEFGRCSDLATHDPRASYAWAFSLAHSGQQKQANALALDLEDAPIDPNALSLVCHIFMDTESYEQSAACYRKLSSKDPGLLLAHYYTGESLLRLDRPADAIPELRKELALSPENSNVRYSLAFALLETSQKDEAQQLLEQVVQADPANAQAQYQLGKLFLDSNNLPAAIQHLEAAEQNDSHADYIHYQLQLAYRKAGRPADAARELALYRDIKSRARATAPARQAVSGK